METETNLLRPIQEWFISRMHELDRLMSSKDVEVWMYTFGTQERTRRWWRDKNGKILVWVDYVSGFLYDNKLNKEGYYAE